MSASKYSEEFKQQVVSGVVEKPLHGQPRWQNPTPLIPQTVRMLGEQAGEPVSTGRTGVCYMQRRSRYRSTPPAQERIRQLEKSTAPKEKRSEAMALWIKY